MYSFLLYAALAGLTITLVTAPLGSFVVWRRMAYFGDTLSHAALLGVALGFLFQLSNPILSVMGVCMGIAGLLLFLERRPQLASDSILGMLSHASLALGVILVARLPNFRGDLFGYLFGDILAVGPQDFVLLVSVVVTVLGILAWNWQALLAMTIHEELAEVEGVPCQRVKTIFVVMLALVIAVAMKILGVLLITAMLIVPPLTARPFAKTPEQMAGMAIIVSMVSVILGLGFSWYFDTPAAPSIVVAATAQFVLAQMIGQLFQKRSALVA
jgi:zinc transport system permease protein